VLLPVPFRSSATLAGNQKWVKSEEPTTVGGENSTRKPGAAAAALRANPATRRGASIALPHAQSVRDQCWPLGTGPYWPVPAAKQHPLQNRRALAAIALATLASGTIASASPRRSPGRA
jgi:hypothetical protein